MREDGERLIEMAREDKFREFTMSELSAIHHFDAEQFWYLKERYRFIAYSYQNPCLLNSFAELGRSLDRMLASEHLGLVRAINYMPDVGFDERYDDDGGDARTVFVINSEHVIEEVSVPWASTIYMLNSNYLDNLLQGKAYRSSDDVGEEVAKVAAYHQEFIRSEGYLHHIAVMLEAAKLSFMLLPKKSEREAVLKI